MQSYVRQIQMTRVVPDDLRQGALAICLLNPVPGPHPGDAPKVTRYNFETGIWSNAQGDKYKNGKLVE